MAYANDKHTKRARYAEANRGMRVECPACDRVWIVEPPDTLLSTFEVLCPACDHVWRETHPLWGEWSEHK